LQSKKATPCPICGGDLFGPGPGGRLSPSGAEPRCIGCGALERHRAFRTVFEALAPDLAGLSALQFSHDASAPRDRFGRFEMSIYGGSNSLDLAAIDRPDGAYDVVVANHVLEHVADDRAALAELARITASDGFVVLSVPDLLRCERTVEYGRPREDKHGHYRLYGPDIAERWRDAVPQWHGVGVVPFDPVSGAADRLTLLSLSEHRAAALADRLRVAGFAPFDALA
jgi:SAM-dependent methyltransferase